VIVSYRLGTEGAAVANHEPPLDVWQLCERAVNMVPLTVLKMQTLLGTPMVEDPQTPGRWEGGPTKLAPSLAVTSSVIAIRDGACLFAAINIEPPPCISVEMVKAHYPAVELRYGPTGHSVYETFGWEVHHDWGALGFGIRVKDDCLATIALEPTNAPPPSASRAGIVVGDNACGPIGNERAITSLSPPAGGWP
jgi:hypothetical protein